jgi:isoquinoline 1-oxidoreductase
MAGVQVVEEGELVAVLHESPAVANEAIEQVKAEWDIPTSTVDDKTIFDHLLNAPSRGNASGQGGDLAQGQALSTKVVETKYLDGYVAHAPIETHTALVNIEEGKATVWASTQAPFSVQSAVARALDFASDKVRVIAPYVGGGFGGKTGGPQAVEAAQLAKATGKPVQVCWTRAEEFFFDTFRPAAVVKIKAGVTDAGKVALWDYNVYHAGSRGAGHFYDIPHHQTMVTGAGWQGGGPHPLATGAWRAPANNTNTFARESHIDVMAAAAGVDPVEFRLNNLKDKRMIGVLKAAAEKFGYQPAKAPSGRGIGVALGIDAGTYVALIA